MIPSSQHVAASPGWSRKPLATLFRLLCLNLAFAPSLNLVISRQTRGSGDWQFEEYLRRACAAVLNNSSPR